MITEGEATQNSKAKTYATIGIWMTQRKREESEQSATTTEEQRLADALVDIAKDATVAKTAARFLNRTARGNWTLRRKYWFTDPERIGRLVQALRASPPEVVVEIVGTLGPSANATIVLSHAFMTFW